MDLRSNPRWIMDRSSTNSTIKSFRAALLFKIKEVLRVCISNKGTVSEFYRSRGNFLSLRLDIKTTLTLEELEVNKGYLILPTDKKEKLIAEKTYFCIGALCEKELFKKISEMTKEQRKKIIEVFEGIEFSKVIASQSKPLLKILGAIWLDSRHIGLKVSDVSLALELYEAQYNYRKSDELTKQLKVEIIKDKNENKDFMLLYNQEREKYLKLKNIKAKDIALINKNSMFLELLVSGRRKNKDSEQEFQQERIRSEEEAEKIKKIEQELQQERIRSKETEEKEKRQNKSCCRREKKEAEAFAKRINKLEEKLRENQRK